MRYLALNDGFDHINIYSRGRTELGRQLSPFYRREFGMPEGVFASLEGYYYFKKSNGEYEDFRDLSGPAAKEFGREMCMKNRSFIIHPATLIQQVAPAVRARIMQDPGLREMLSQSTLPFAHYYNFQGKLIDRSLEDAWLIDTVTAVRQELQSAEPAS